jgi:hypothetical protein
VPMASIGESGDKGLLLEFGDVFLLRVAMRVVW